MRVLLLLLLAPLAQAGVMTFGNSVLLDVADINGQPISPASVTAGTVTITSMLPGSVIFSTTGGRLSQDNANFSYDASAASLRVSSLNVQGSAFSVGGSSFTVSGGSATVAYGFTSVSLTANGGLTTLRGKETQYELGLSSTADTSTGKFFIGTNTDGVTPTRQALVLSNNAGAELVRVTNAGNVGIGTTAPGFALHVNGVAVSSGVTDGSSAAAGSVGEFISTTPVGNLTFAATGIFTNISTTTLTPGDWDVQGVCDENNGGTYAGTAMECCISLTKNAIDDFNYCSQVAPIQGAAAIDTVMSTMQRRINVTVNTAVYLGGGSTFSVLGAATWRQSGTSIRARRVR